MAIVTSKGRITLPASVRAALGVDAGDRIEFIPRADGRFENVVPANEGRGDEKADPGNDVERSMAASSCLFSTQYAVCSSHTSFCHQTPL